VVAVTPSCGSVHTIEVDSWRYAVDDTQLAQAVTSFLLPFLPYLVGKAGDAVAEVTVEKSLEAAWESAKALWQKLRPRVESRAAAKEAAVDAAQDRDDEDAQAALRLQLRKLLAADDQLSEELAELLRGAKAAAVTVATGGPRSIAAGTIVESTTVTGDDNVIGQGSTIVVRSDVAGPVSGSSIVTAAGDVIYQGIAPQAEADIQLVKHRDRGLEWGVEQYRGLMPTAVSLFLNFYLHNRGGGLGNVEDVMPKQALVHPSSAMCLRYAGMRKGFRQDRFGRPIQFPFSLQPGEQMAVCAYLYATVPEVEPETFAQYLVELQLCRVVLRLKAQGQLGPLPDAEAIVTDDFAGLKRGICAYWTENGRNDLVSIAMED
jgi:hypothetical protein